MHFVASDWRGDMTLEQLEIVRKTFTRVVVENDEIKYVTEPWVESLETKIKMYQLKKVYDS